MNAMNMSAREVSELVTELQHTLSFTGCPLFNDYTIYNTIPISHISNTGGNHIIKSDKTELK